MFNFVFNFVMLVFSQFSFTLLLGFNFCMRLQGSMGLGQGVYTAFFSCFLYYVLKDGNKVFNIISRIMTVIFKNQEIKTTATKDQLASFQFFFSEGFERIILERSGRFLNGNDIFTDSQYGIRKNRSPELFLFQKEQTLDDVERKNLVLGIFVNFTKVLGPNHKSQIKHNILMKFGLYEIKGQASHLIHSYPSSRKQYVHINIYKSTIRYVNSGVPQGCIPGPLLSNQFIKDIVNIDTNARFIIYADDTSIFLPGETYIDLIINANNMYRGIWKHHRTNIRCQSIEQNIKLQLFAPKIRHTAR